MCTIERNGESKLEQKLPTPASWDNGIKTDVAVVFFLLTVVDTELPRCIPKLT